MGVTLSMGVIRATVGRFDADSTEWALTRRQAVALAAIPVAIAAIGLSALPFERVYALLANEDALVEWVQFLFVLAMIVLSAMLAIALWRQDHRWLALLYAVAALGAVFIAGEEVSWGHRIVGFLTPAELEDINKQGEANIHNVGSILGLFNLGVMVVSLAALVLPVLRWTVWRDRARSVAGYVLIPPFALATAFAIPFAYRAVRLLFLPDAGARTTKYAEFAELCFYFGLVVFFLLARRSIQRSGPPAPERPTADT
jgi:hypothetical protein